MSIRRSARLSSAAPSVVSPSIATGTTPGRRRGPLPKVKARHSTAYGASGRLGTAEELSLPVTGFAQAFESQRGAAVGRNEEPLMSGALNGEDATTPSPPGRDSSEEPSDAEPDQSGADTSKSFGMMREAGMLGAVHPVPPHRGLERPQIPPGDRPSVRSPLQAPSGPPVQAQIGETSGNTGAFRPYLLGALCVLLTIAFFMLASYGSSGQLPEDVPRAVSMANAIMHRISYTWNNVAEFINPVEKAPFPHYPDHEYDTMWSWFNGKHREHANKHKEHEQKHEQTAQDLQAIQDTLSNLQDHLPDHLVILRKKDGSWQIGDDFWKALLSKMQSEGPLDIGGTSKDWETFLEKNRANMRELVQKSIDLTDAKVWPELIRRQEFTFAMERRWQELSEHVDKKIAEQVDALKKDLKKTAAKEAKQAHVDQVRLQSLALTNLLANLELNLQKVNYFSPGLGAMIDMGITSATFADNPAIIARLYRRLMLAPERRPPSAALDPWQEPGDCWCSAPDSARSGKAQIGITLPEPMHPTQITIEHLPKTAAPRENISNAPREVELWVQTTEKASYHFKELENRCDPGPAGWVCLGRVTYDIRGANHVQTFNLDGQSHVPVTNTMVRVVSNWGGDHTCVYRIRLHGDDAGPKHEYPVFN